MFDGQVFFYNSQNTCAKVVILDQANNNWTLMKPNQLCVITMSHDDNNESKVVEISDM